MGHKPGATSVLTPITRPRISDPFTALGRIIESLLDGMITKKPPTKSDYALAGPAK